MLTRAERKKVPSLHSATKPRFLQDQFFWNSSPTAASIFALDFRQLFRAITNVRFGQDWLSFEATRAGAGRFGRCDRISRREATQVVNQITTLLAFPNPRCVLAIRFAQAARCRLTTETESVSAAERRL